ncbi:ABC transporter permease [Ktedonosporobacter rubrisoli]|uniref:ABC transporter permease n=1 Tax=Ktedonosporobacter rubrisoli TaxID=2509675 RepID=A0A4P6K3J7_KTERU|nr:ABC transporter permease [Ktedonosporobacter rubrisoli]QBD82837.1 ABC transporter permease [Ktedonosporobacter rubrisoli]
MKLALAYFQAETLQLLRIPFVFVASLLFPALFFLILGLPNAHDSITATAITLSFTVYAVIGIAFFQFGVGIAADRFSLWEQFLRTLPVVPLTRFTGRILTAMFFAFVAGGLVIMLGLLVSPARITSSQCIPLGIALLAGCIPFSLLGLAIGYWLTPQAALPVANILYFVFGYCGGLWIPPQYLPSFIAAISPYLPTRQYGELVWSVVLNRPWPASPWFGLLLYSLFFGAMALWGYKRDEGKKYS